MRYCSRWIHTLHGIALASVSWVLLQAPVAAEDLTSPNQRSESDGAAATSAAQERASQHFDRGVALYRDGAFEGAFIEFRRAYEAVPTPGLLFNMGQTSVRLNDYAQAKVLFERYLQSAAAEMSAERRKLVATELERIHSRIGYAQISVSVSGAEVWVDQRSVGRTPLSEPLALNLGRHHVEVRADGHQAEVQTVELAGGEERTLEFRLRQVSEQSNTPPVAPAQVAQLAEERRRPWLRPARISSLAVLGVAVAGAVATGVLASKAHKDLESELASRPGDPSAIDDSRSRTRTFSLTSDALLGVAAVSAALSVTFLWMERADRRAVSLAVGATGVAVKGDF